MSLTFQFQTYIRSFFRFSLIAVYGYPKGDDRCFKLSVAPLYQVGKRFYYMSYSVTHNLYIMFVILHYYSITYYRLEFKLRYVSSCRF